MWQYRQLFTIIKGTLEKHVLFNLLNIWVLDYFTFLKTISYFHYNKNAKISTVLKNNAIILHFHCLSQKQKQ
jgi:hypothetical protein